jgi:hypothetical protein
MTRRSTFDKLAAAKVVDGARLAPAMPPNPAYELLRQYVGMRIIEVADRSGDLELTVGPVGHMTRRRLLIIGDLDARDITDFRDSALADLDGQHDDDIGDEMAERERFADHDIDVAPGVEQRSDRRPW